VKPKITIRLAMTRGNTLAVLVFLSICFSGLSHAGLVRVPNRTLALPSRPPERGYKLVDAFGELSFFTPVCIVSPPGESNRVFIVEKAGEIYVINDLANPTKTLFLDLTSKVTEAGDGGVLGMAFHPGYLTNRFFFVYYTLDMRSSQGDGHHLRLSRFEISPNNPNETVPRSEVPYITQFHESDTHFAGDIHFGPDGYLYISLGDAEAGSTFTQQIDRDFFSGILRIDVDKRPGSLPPNPHPAVTDNYAIPPDNPFVGATNFNGNPLDPASVRTEFWAVGLRNPWRMSFDAVIGTLYCADVGQETREEIDIILKGGNYGWDYREGSIAYPREDPPPEGVTFIEPIFDYGRMGMTEDPTREGNCIIGGVIYRGSTLPELIGEYIFGDYISGNVWALHVDGTNSSNFRRLATMDRPTTFGIDPSNGDVLITEDGSGKILRLVYSDDPIEHPLPATLADTGAFSDLLGLVPHPGVVPYALNVPFWSDGAQKSRWFSVPDTNLLIGFQTNANWSFPTGSVWIKHFELELTNGVPESRRRLETRFLVRDDANAVYGITYRWGDSTTNADLVPEQGTNETFVIHDGSTVRTQVWHYPARSECLICHTRVGGLALGFNTPQLNRNFNYDGDVQNQLLAFHAAGYFDDPLPEPETLPQLARASDSAFSTEHRVRSYLAANCVQCHQPGGSGRGSWDARFSTPLSEAGIVDGDLDNNFGDPLNRVIRPGSIQRSILLQRLSTWGPTHMPPLATSELNQEAISLLTEWIMNDLAQPLPRLVSIFLDQSGQVRISFTGAKSRAYNVESTSNLKDWQWTATVQTDRNGAGEYQEPSSTTANFYRIVLE
jgi:glucose/arabinose dehydrogenase